MPAFVGTIQGNQLIIKVLVWWDGHLMQQVAARVTRSSLPAGGQGEHAAAAGFHSGTAPTMAGSY